MNRRHFLQASAGLAMLPYGNVAFSAEQDEDKACIFVHLGGGITQIEFLNPIPNATDEYKSVTGNVAAKGGYLLGGHFKELAAIGDKLSVVRSFHHRDANHQSATMWVNTSEFHIPNQGQKWPSYGSVIAHQFEPNNGKNGIPHYVKSRQIQGDDGAWLGARFNGYDADAEGVANLKPRTEMGRFQNRLKMMEKLDDQSRFNKNGMSQSWGILKKQASQIVQGTASQAFDLSLEPEAGRQLYDADKNTLGKDFLLARRLVEAGTKFVTVTTGGWDMHSNIEAGMNSRAPQLDKYLAVLIKDLEDRGLSDKVMVVVTSEFARTPKVNRNAGRDHWPGTNSLLFAGGGHDHGRVIGSTDKLGTVVTEGKCGPSDLARTIFDHFGVNPKLTIVDKESRPRHMIKDTARNILTG